MTVGTNTVPVELPFSDITDNLETAFIVHFEGMYKSNWGFLIDVNYLDLSSDVTLPGPFSVPGNVDFDATLAEFSALYRLPYEGYSFDLIAGLRYTKLENKLTLNTGPTLVDASQDWTDPLLGVRWKWGFADQWTLVARGDVGGFWHRQRFSPFKGSLWSIGSPLNTCPFWPAIAPSTRTMMMAVGPIGSAMTRLCMVRFWGSIFAGNSRLGLKNKKGRNQA